MSIKLSFVIIKSKKHIDVDFIIENFKLREKLFFIKEVIPDLSASAYYYILEFPFGNLSSIDIYRIYMTPIFGEIGSENFVLIDQFFSDKRFNLEGKMYENLFVINPKADIIENLTKIIKDLFIGGFIIEEGEFYHKVMSARPEDNYRLHHFLKNFTSFICKKSLSSLPAVDISNLDHIESFKKLLESDSIKTVFIDVPVPFIINCKVISDRKLRIMLKNKRDAICAIDKMNEAIWGDKKIIAKMAFKNPSSSSSSLVSFTPPPSPSPSGPRLKRFVLSNFNQILETNQVKEIFNKIINSDVSLLNHPSDNQLQEFVISVDSQKKENKLNSFLDTYVHNNKIIPYIFPYSEDALDANRRNKVKSLLSQNTVVYTFSQKSNKIPPFTSIISSLNYFLNAIIRCIVCDEEDKRKIYVSFQTEHMMKRAISKNYKICQKNVEKAEYVAKQEIKAADNYVSNFRPSNKQKSTHFIPNNDTVDDDILFLSNNRKISGFVTFKSCQSFNELDRAVKNQIIAGSVNRPNKKGLYPYLINVGDADGFDSFVDKYPMYHNVCYIEQNKKIINCPPGLNRYNFSSIFEIPINCVIQLPSPRFFGCSKFVVIFDSIKKAKKFDLFMTTEQRSINRHIIFAYNSAEATAASEINRVYDFIINQEDSYPVVIKNLPINTNYYDIHKLCLFTDMELNEKLQKMIKTKLIIRRNCRDGSNLLFIVVYSTEVAKDFALKNINKFRGKKIICNEYHREDIINDTETVFSRDTTYTELEQNNQTPGNNIGYIWDEPKKK